VRGERTGARPLVSCPTFEMRLSLVMDRPRRASAGKLHGEDITSPFTPSRVRSIFETGTHDTPLKSAAVAKKLFLKFGGMNDASSCARVPTVNEVFANGNRCYALRDHAIYIHIVNPTRCVLVDANDCWPVSEDGSGKPHVGTMFGAIQSREMFMVERPCIFRSVALNEGSDVYKDGNCAMISMAAAIIYGVLPLVEANAIFAREETTMSSVYDMAVKICKAKPSFKPCIDFMKLNT